MAGVFDQMKNMGQLISMQREMKRIQKELSRKTVDAVSGDVTVTAAGDMTLRAVRIAPEALPKLKPEQLDRMIVTAANKALEEAKKQAGAAMSGMAGGLGGLADMMRGG